MFELVILVIFAYMLFMGIVLFFFKVIKEYKYKKDDDHKKIKVTCKFSRDPWAKIDREEEQEILEHFLNGITYTEPVIVKTQIPLTKNVSAPVKNIVSAKQCIKV